MTGRRRKRWRSTKRGYANAPVAVSAAMAAESYAKVTGGLGVCLVTAGPGGTNAITGVAGAWLEADAELSGHLGP